MHPCALTLEMGSRMNETEKATMHDVAPPLLLQVVGQIFYKAES